MPNVDSLQKYPLFEGLSEDDLARLIRHIHKRAFARGAYLFYPGSPSTNTYLVESGLVRLFFTNARGEEFLINLVQHPQVFGLPVPQPEDTRLMGAAVSQDAVILSVASGCLMEAMQSMPLLARNLYREASASARMVLMYNRALVTLDLSARLAALLLHIARSSQSAVVLDMPINQSHLASWLGASRGRLNQALMDFQKQGFIRLEDKHIRLLDQAALEHLSQDGG